MGTILTSSLLAFIAVQTAGISSCHAVGNTGCLGADLRADRIEFTVVSTEAGRSVVRISGVVRNDGPSDFESKPGKQSIALFEGRRFLADRSFQTLKAGQEARVDFALEFDPNQLDPPAIYELAIIYDPGIFQDGNPANDDCDHNNNRIRRSGSRIVELLR